jgi:hypothetical protein
VTSSTGLNRASPKTRGVYSIFLEIEADLETRPEQIAVAVFAPLIHPVAVDHDGDGIDDVTMTVRREVNVPVDEPFERSNVSFVEAQREIEERLATGLPALVAIVVSAALVVPIAVVGTMPVGDPPAIPLAIVLAIVLPMSGPTVVAAVRASRRGQHERERERACGES